MPFIEAKVYYDGSHYICIPYNPPKKRKKKKVTPDLSGFKQLSDEEVKNIFKDELGYIVPGKCTSKIPSTIVDFSKKEPILIREGAIAFKDILEVYHG